MTILFFLLLGLVFMLGLFFGVALAEKKYNIPKEYRL